MLLLVAVYTLTYSGVFHSDDEMSVAAAAESLVKRGSLAIDQLRWNQDLSGGIGKYGLDGHLYSKYGWGASLALAPLYLAARALPPLGNAQAANLLNIFVTALTGVLVMRCARRLGAGEGGGRGAGAALRAGDPGLALRQVPLRRAADRADPAGGLLLPCWPTATSGAAVQPACSPAWRWACAVAVKTANAAAIPVFALQLAIYEWQATAGTPAPRPTCGGWSAAGSSWPRRCCWPAASPWPTTMSASATSWTPATWPSSASPAAWSRACPACC